MLSAVSVFTKISYIPIKISATTNDQDKTRNASPVKKLKLDSNGKIPTNASPSLKPVAWERESDKSTWTEFSANQVEVISEAFKAGKPDVDIKDGKSEIMVIFERMVQRNKKTGWEKRIRCTLVDGSVDPDECKRMICACLFLYRLLHGNRVGSW